MEIRITSVEVTDESQAGLGECYRIYLQTPAGQELNILPRMAVAADMELYGVDDPLVILDWRLHGYRATTSLSGASATPAELQALAARELDAQVEYTAAAVAADPVTLVSIYAGAGNPAASATFGAYTAALGEQDATTTTPEAVSAAADVLALAETIRTQAGAQADELAAQVATMKAQAALARQAEVDAVKASVAAVAVDSALDLLRSLLTQDAELLAAGRRDYRRAFLADLEAPSGPVVG